MEQESKLTKFEAAVFAEIDAQVEKIRCEAESEKSAVIRKNKDDQLMRSMAFIQKQTQDIRRKSKRDAAKFSLDAKRDILKKRSEITDRIFDAVAKRLKEFSSQNNYVGYLEKRLRAFSKENPLSGVRIFVKDADFSHAEQIKAAYGLPCEVLRGSSVKLGGFIVQDDANNIYFDETLDHKLSDQKSYFIEKSDLSL